MQFRGYFKSARPLG